MEQSKGEKRFTSEKRSEITLEIVEKDLIFDGKKLNEKLSAIEDTKNLLNKLKGREKLKECSGDEDDRYDKLAWGRAISLEIELEEKKKELESSIVDFLQEKTLREMKKGKEINEKTSLIFDRKIRLISEKIKEGERISLLAWAQHDLPELNELYKMSFEDLEKKARREAMSHVYKGLSLEEKNKHLELHGKSVKDFKAKIEEELNRE